MRKRSLLAALVAVGVVVAVALTQTSLFRSRRAPGKFSQRLVILGFDGMDPALVGKWMKEGKLPNLKRLAEQGGMFPLATTHSPESPTAWASFATGVNPGKHNIYDFLVRDTTTYLPDLGMVRREPARFLFDYVPYAKPKLFSIRGATSFWVTAGKAGVRSSVLTVPVTFPPEPVPNGEMLSGLPLPDIRGTMGTFYYFATDLSRYEEGNTEFGGIEAPVDRERRRAHGAHRATQSDHQAEDPGPPRESAIARRRRSCRDRRTPGQGGRADPVHDPLEPLRKNRDR